MLLGVICDSFSVINRLVIIRLIMMKMRYSRKLMWNVVVSFVSVKVGVRMMRLFFLSCVVLVGGYSC